MRYPALGLGALLTTLLAVSFANAGPQPHYTPLPPYAPDVCNGCGWYNSHPNGMTYGPNYWLQPPWMPFNGFVPPVANGNGGGNGGGNGNGNGLPGSPVFATHPYARSPRDYFMIDVGK